MHISLTSQKIAEIGPLPITNSMIMSWASAVILIVLAFIATRQMKSMPSGLQNVMETVVEYLYNTSNDILGDIKKTKKYFPLVATIFLFILVNNWLGIIPGVGTIGFSETIEGKHVLVPILRPGNADLNNTLALAVITVFSIQIIGIAAIGFFKYGKKFINFKSPIDFFIGILELISEVAKMISFSFRLFGNIFAGEVLLTVVAVIAPFAAPIPFFGLELFVGFVQALVFCMLTLVFIKMAITDHAEEH